MNTQPKELKRKNRTELWYNMTKRIAVVAAVLGGILSVLMIANYIQTKSVDPLNSQD
jgi:K+-transporting ATPase A subunit